MRVSAFAFLQFCVFWHPQIRPTSPFFGNLYIFKKSKFIDFTFPERPQNRQHSSDFGNFEGFWKAQPQIRLNARILAIWEGFGKSKVVENHENLQILVFWRPQNKQNSSGFGNFGGFWKAQNGWGCQKLSKIAKFAILGSPESAFCFVIFLIVSIYLNPFTSIYLNSCGGSSIFINLLLRWRTSTTLLKTDRNKS